MRAGRPPDGGSAAVEAVLADAAAGDATALAALDEVGRWLGIGLAGLVNMLNPARVVLGGRFARLHPFIAATVEDGARPAGARRARGRSSRSCRRRSASTPRCSAPPSWRSSRSSTDPASWFQAPASRRPVHMVTDEEGVQLT